MFPDCVVMHEVVQVELKAVAYEAASCYARDGRR